jgi:quinol monooxygenase YgiN
MASKPASTGDDVLSGSSWATEYCVFGVLSSKDDQKVMDLYKADGRLQVDEEVGAPRLSYLGLPSAATGPVEGMFAAFEAPCKPPSQRVYWLASFNDKECYDTEHKARPSNQAFVPQFMSCWVGWPEEGFKMPEEKDKVFALAMTASDGQYMGPYWHLEKPGKSVDSDVFTTVVYVKAKSPAAALEIISLNKAHGVKQLNSEVDALRYSIIPPHKVGVEGIGATDMPPLLSDDELTVTWIESFASQESYGLHKATEHVEAFTPKLKELIQGEIVVLEFAQAIHMAKPV